MSSPRNRFTGLPELIISPLCHYCGIEVDMLHDIVETHTNHKRVFHWGCYIDYTGSDPSLNELLGGNNDFNRGVDEDG